MPPSSDQKRGGPSGSGAGTSARIAAHEAAPALGRRQQGRERRRGGHVVDRARVDAANERIDQRVDDTPAQLVRHEGADGAVSHGAAGVGPGRHGIAGEAERPREPRMPERAVGQNRVGIPTAWPFGQGAEAPAGPPPTRPGPQIGAPAAATRPRCTTRPPHVGGRGSRLVRHRPAAPDFLALQRATEARRGLEHRHLGRAGPGHSAPVSSQAAVQAADAAADDDDPRHSTQGCSVGPDDQDRPGWR